MVNYRYWWLMIDELDDVVRYSNKTTSETDTKDLQNWKRHIFLYCMLFLYVPYILHLYVIFLLLYIIDFMLYTIFYIHYIYTLYIYIHWFHNKKVICLGGESCSSKFLDLSRCEHREHRTKTDHATHVFTAKKGVHFGMYKKIVQRGTSQSIESSKYLSSKSCVKAIVQGLSFLMCSPIVFCLNPNI